MTKKQADQKLLQDIFDDVLEHVPNGKWVVLEMTLKKNGKKWDIAEGGGFGPHILEPKTIPGK